MAELRSLWSRDTSVREWLVRGETGLIVDPADDEGLAWAMLRALEDDGMRAAAARSSPPICESARSYASRALS